MARAAMKAYAGALLSPPPCAFPSSTRILPRVRDPFGRAAEAALSRTHRERVRCGCVQARGFHDVRRAFNGTPTRTLPLPAWTAIISGCARGGRYGDGMRAFAEMLSGGSAATPNAFVLAGVLRCCAGLGDAESARRVHGWILRSGVRPDVVLCNAILDMYAKCGDDHGLVRRAFGAMAEKDTVSWNIVVSACLQDGHVLGAMQLFDESPLRDVSSWNTIISGLMWNGCATEALDCLRRMVRAGVMFSNYTYSMAFALASMLSLQDLGRHLHGRVVVASSEDDAFVRCSLMDMYCKCARWRLLCQYLIAGHSS